MIYFKTLTLLFALGMIYAIIDFSIKAENYICLGLIPLLLLISLSLFIKGFADYILEKVVKFN